MKSFLLIFIVFNFILDCELEKNCIGTVTFLKVLTTTGIYALTRSYNTAWEVQLIYNTCSGTLLCPHLYEDSSRPGMCIYNPLVMKHVIQ